MKQTECGRPFDAGSFARDTLIGGAVGFLGGAAGPVLGAAVRGVTSTGAGAAAIAATRSSVQNALSRAPSFRPSAAPVRPSAMAGGGSKPSGMSSAGASCRTNSFVPGTLVLMGDGKSKPIEDVRLGDTVLAADPETGEFGSRPVTAPIEGTGVKELVTIATEHGSVGATAVHPFWSESDAVWVDAGDLEVGDAVLEADGGTSVVTGLAEVVQPATVRNLTVADLHTYFVVVGDAPTLVHNCGGGSSGTPNRNERGQFTSAAGGDSASTAAGRTAHLSYSNTLPQGNWVFNRAIAGTRLRPDAVDYSNKVIRELNPDSPGAIASGWRQLERYRQALGGGDDWTLILDLYKR